MERVCTHKHKAKEIHARIVERSKDANQPHGTEGLKVLEKQRFFRCCLLKSEQVEEGRHDRIVVSRAGGARGGVCVAVSAKVAHLIHEHDWWKPHIVPASFDSLFYPPALTATAGCPSRQPQNKGSAGRDDATPLEMLMARSPHFHLLCASPSPSIHTVLTSSASYFFPITPLFHPSSSSLHIIPSLLPLPGLLPPHAAALLLHHLHLLLLGRSAQRPSCPSSATSSSTAASSFSSSPPPLPFPCCSASSSFFFTPPLAPLPPVPFPKSVDDHQQHFHCGAAFHLFPAAGTRSSPTSHGGTFGRPLPQSPGGDGLA